MAELKGNKYGTHRVIEPQGVLTQAAWKVDNDMTKEYSNEIICDVTSLNIDSASFTQISEACGGDEKKIGEMILGIVAERGKQQKVRAMADAEVSLRLRMARYRQNLSAQYFSHLGSEEAGIAAAMSLGDKRSLDAAQRQSFSATGVSHVLALSGLHLGILFSLYSLLFVNRLPSRRGRVFASLVGVALLWGFALLVGFPLSLVRAGGKRPARRRMDGTEKTDPFRAAHSASGCHDEGGRRI